MTLGATTVAGQLLRKNEVLVASSNMYIYAGDYGGWASIDSSLASREISSRSGSMASVNVDAVSDPVKEVLVTRGVPSVMIPSSVCVSSGRYGVRVVKEAESGGEDLVLIGQRPLNLMKHIPGKCPADTSVSVSPLNGISYHAA